MNLKQLTVHDILMKCNQDEILKPQPTLMIYLDVIRKRHFALLFCVRPLKVISHCVQRLYCICLAVKRIKVGFHLTFVEHRRNGV